MISVNNCLIIDTETDGNPESQSVLEIGAVLYSLKFSCMLACGSSLISTNNTDNSAFLINKIPIAATKETAENQGFMRRWLQSAYEEADVIVAHGAAFDKPLVLSLDLAQDWDKTWLCTYQDFELFPDIYQGKKDLISLAQFYGVGISVTHRAIDDCLLIKEVFNRVPDLPEQFRIAHFPLIEALAPKTDESLKIKGFRWDYNRQGWFKKDKGESWDFPVSEIAENRCLYRAFVDYDNRQIAKDWGFIWNPESKVWERLLSPDAAKFLPFSVGRTKSQETRVS